MKIVIEVNEQKFNAELSDSSNIAKALIKKMPMHVRADTWKGEVYFSVPIVENDENPVQDLKKGDIVYWKQCGCVGIFYGPTPLSKDHNPKAIEPVSVIGKVTDDPAPLEKVKLRDKVTIRLA